MADDLPARNQMEFDVVIVGAGPPGSAATQIRLKQVSPDLGRGRGREWAQKWAPYPVGRGGLIRSVSTACCRNGGTEDTP
jgi:hypothetical protein